MTDSVVVKSVRVTGNLKNDNFIFRPFPSDELNHFRFVSINSVSWFCEENVNEILTVSCNMIKSQKYSSGFGEIITEEHPLVTFQLKSQNNMSNCVRFPLSWFTINSLSDKLQFTFKNFDDQSVNKNCKISIIVYKR